MLTCLLWPATELWPTVPQACINGKMPKNTTACNPHLLAWLERDIHSRLKCYLLPHPAHFLAGDRPSFTTLQDQQVLLLSTSKGYEHQADSAQGPSRYKGKERTQSEYKGTGEMLGQDCSCQSCTNPFHHPDWLHLAGLLNISNSSAALSRRKILVYSVYVRICLKCLKSTGLKGFHLLLF